MTKTEITSRVADNIRAQMAIARVSQVKLGLKLGRSSVWVNRRANGDVDPTVSELDEIAAGLGIPISALLEGVVTPGYDDDVPPEPLTRTRTIGVVVPLHTATFPTLPKAS